MNELIKSKINKKDITGTLSDLVSINSVNPAYSKDALGEQKVAEYIRQFLVAHGISSEFQEVLPNRCNVLGMLPGSHSRTNLVLEAHMDTVSVKGMTISPFQPNVEGSRLYGRGSCDTKASIAAMLHALKLLLDIGEQPLSNITFLGTVDEEDGQHGIKKVIESGKGYSAAVVGEPTDLNIVRAHNGCVRWNIIVEGKSAHTSKPHLGVNAIVKMGKVIRAIEEKIQPLLKEKIHPLVGKPVLTISMIEGGTQGNMVPDECAIRLDRRIIPGENKNIVWEEFLAVLAQVRNADPELKLRMEEPLKVSRPMETPENERIIQVASQALENVTGNPKIIGASYGTDASPLSHARTPAIVLGPGSVDQAHTADEWVNIDQVALCVEVYARIMLNYSN